MTDSTTIIIDKTIDDQSIRIWTCFTDRKVNQMLQSLESFQKLNEAVEGSLNGKQWEKLPFWRKMTNFIAPGVNYDGTKKGLFELPKFPVRILKASEVNADSLLKALNDGVGVKVDYAGATPEQAQTASRYLWKAFDRQFLIAHSQAAKDASDVVGAGGAAVGYMTGGAPGAAAGGATAKGWVLNKEQEIVDRFNDSIKGTQYENLKITHADQHHSWFDQLVMFVCAHPYVSVATVIAMVLVWKNRQWIWDRLKLGFGNLWQGKIIAKYQFKLVNGQDLSFEYDLRFNKWRLLYKDFKWKGDAYPDEMMIKSFIKTNHCKKFISKCKQYMNAWFEHEDEIRKIVAMNEDPELKNPVKLILSILDDKEDIMRTFTQLEYKVG